MSNLHRTIDVRNIRQDSAVAIDTKLYTTQQIALINNFLRIEPIISCDHFDVSQVRTIQERKPISTPSFDRITET